MSHDDVLQQVEKIVEEKGLLLVDVNLFQAGRRKVLRILVDKRGRVNLDECAEVSRAVGNAIETLDLIDSGYTLEVSSPGIGRPLTTANDWTRCIGRKIEVKTESDEITGILSDFSGDILRFDNGVEIELDSVMAAREVI